MSSHPSIRATLDWEEPLNAETGRSHSDHSLLVQLRFGKQDAATALYVRYAKRLTALARKQTSAAFARRFDPDDVVQSVFRTFFRRAAAGHYDIPAGDELWRLFLVIALNKVRETTAFHRATKRDVAATSGSESLDRAAKVKSTGDEVALTTLQLVVDEVLGNLPRVQRDIVRERIEGREIAEISDRIGRSKRTVERVLQQFRQSLRQALDLDPKPSDR